jgi:hypothetical protein
MDDIEVARFLSSTRALGTDQAFHTEGSPVGHDTSWFRLTGCVCVRAALQSL